MIVFIKGEPESGKSTLADRLVDRLGLAPVDWDLPADLVRRAQSQMGGWLDLSAEYFGSCRHLDMSRVVARLQIERWDVLPRAPRWQPDADRGQMIAWRREVMREIYDGRLLPDLFELTCGLIQAQPVAVVEGGVLGTRFSDSRLNRMLRRRFLDRYQLHFALARTHEAGEEGGRIATVNGRTLDLEEAAQVLSRRRDGAVIVNPQIGWTWAGGGAGASPHRHPPTPAAEEGSLR